MTRWPWQTDLTPVLQAIRSLRGEVAALRLDVHTILSKEITMSASLDDLKAEVSADTDVLSSLETAIDGVNAILVNLQAQLAAAIASGDPQKVQDVLDAMKANTATLTAERDALAAAVLANTPAQP